MFWLALLTCVMLIVNGAVLGLIYMSGNMPWGPRGSNRRELRSMLASYRPSSSHASRISEEELLNAWLQVRVPHKRKLALIAAGISHIDAKSPSVKRLSLDELRVMRALSSTF